MPFAYHGHDVNDSANPAICTVRSVCSWDLMG
jgi:hypothetical protein